MKEKKNKLFICVLTLLLCLSMSLPCMATYRKSIRIPANQEWTTAGSESRSGNYSYVSAENHSVYPESGTDLFSTIQCKVTNSSGTRVCANEVYYLSETGGSVNIYMREGYLNTTTVYFKFRGNSSSAAYAVVSYYGK